MMRTVLLSLALLAACVSAPAAQEARHQPYLEAAPLDPRLVLTPPPAPGSAAEAADRAAYADALRFVDTPRWREALAASSERVEDVAAGFSDAAGRELSAQATPAVLQLLRRAYADMGPSVQAAKAAFDRARPYAENTTRICYDMTPEERAQARRSFPSGHAVTGWLTGYILAAALPERADAILAHARMFGENRVVCRVHFPSDVLAGQELAAALFARLQSDDEFHADLMAARRELMAR